MQKNSVTALILSCTLHLLLFSILFLRFYPQIDYHATNTTIQVYTTSLQGRSFTTSTFSQTLNKNGYKPKKHSLLILLHNLIQIRLAEHPVPIPKFVQNRSAIVSFTLNPDGKITNLKLVTSSGINYIDSYILQQLTMLEPGRLVPHSTNFNLAIEISTSSGRSANLGSVANQAS